MCTSCSGKAPPRLSLSRTRLTAHRLTLDLVHSEADLQIRCISDNTAQFFERDPKAMLGQSLLDFFEEPQRVASALKMKDLSLANPITVYVKKPDGSKVRHSNETIPHRNSLCVYLDDVLRWCRAPGKGSTSVSGEKSHECYMSCVYIKMSCA